MAVKRKLVRIPESKRTKTLIFQYDNGYLNILKYLPEEDDFMLVVKLDPDGKIEEDVGSWDRHDRPVRITSDQLDQARAWQKATQNKFRARYGTPHSTARDPGSRRDLKSLHSRQNFRDVPTVMGKRKKRRSSEAFVVKARLTPAFGGTRIRKHVFLNGFYYPPTDLKSWSRNKVQAFHMSYDDAANAIRVLNRHPQLFSDAHLEPE